MNELIYHVIETFYKKVMDDVLIGYHFEKFRDPEVLHHHLVRLAGFWEVQLSGTTETKFEKPFHLLFTHLQLKIHKGELGRWIMLFHQTLDSLEQETGHPDIKKMNEMWKERIVFFEERFKMHPQMFNHN